MSRKFLVLLSKLTMIISLLLGVVDPAEARNVASNNTLNVDTNPMPIRLAADSSMVTWDLLGLSELHLVGPYDSAYFAFGLPADWKLIAETELNLSMVVSITTGVQNQSDSTADNLNRPEIIGGGTLTITLNNTTLAVLPLEEIGQIERSIPIPLEAFLSSRIDGRMLIGINLNAGISCYYYDQVNVVIRTSSYFNLPHEFIYPSTALINFPRPIFQNSFIPDSALFVIPDNPSEDELRAALTLAHGLGNLSSNAVAIDVLTLSKLTTEQKTTNDLIFVGKAGSLPILNQLELPLSADIGQFQIFGGDTDDGVVEMINSPWSRSHVVMVISGTTDQGTVKAAQAVSTGVLRPNRSPNLAIIQEVQSASIQPPQPVDQTLADLGYQIHLFENRGAEGTSYYFNIPPGWTVTPEASFNLWYGHSALLDYTRSGIVVLLNDKPIGSVRMGDATASLSVNKVQINIPASAVLPGKNRIDVRMNLIPHDECSPPTIRGLWASIWPESMLHLPVELAPINPVSISDLSSYPAPFIYYPSLNNTAFLLERNDLESWQSALKIATFLGSYTNSPFATLSVFYGDNLPEAERSKYSFIIIGRPSQMPIVGELNAVMPVPFLDGGDVPAEDKFQVTYRIPAESPMGYIEIMTSPWNSDNVVFAVLGNTTQGVHWASSSLNDPVLRSKLAGNFAVINGEQIITTDTRLAPTVNIGSTQAAEVMTIPPTNTDITNFPVQSLSWVFPAFVVSVALIILISLSVAIRSWSRKRTRKNIERGRSEIKE